MEKAELTLDPNRVREVIGRHMLADGMDLVIDLEGSRGSRLLNARDGKSYLDFFGCYATIPIGYNHPRLTSREALAELGRAAVQKPSNSDLYSVEMARFVETFGRVAKPSFMRYLFFIEGGALAVENALKVAFDWKVRRNLAKGAGEKGSQVIHFRQAFHGRSGYTLSLTNTADPRKTAYFPKFAWPRVQNPKCVFPLDGENLARVIRDEEEALRQIRTVLDKDADDVACLILEPIQGEGGDNHFRPEFHQALRRVCDENHILMIYDEVQTGMGATGTMWASEQLPAPDLIAFGKKSQVCGVMAGPRVDEVPDNVFHVASRINSTWGGNLADMVRCRMILEVYEEEGVLEHCRRMGRLLQDELVRMQSDFPERVSNARGKGLFCAIDLPTKDMRDRLIKKMFSRQVVVLGCGERSIRFRTALNIPEDDLREGLDRLRQTLSTLEN